jgi:hypothetical protein
LLIKPGCTCDELHHRRLRDPQPIAAEVKAKKVEAFLDPADEGLIGVILYRGWSGRI